MFSICVLISIRLVYEGDTNCQSVMGQFVAVLTQYSLLGSELSYCCLAIDALVSVSRPFTNPKTRYTLFDFCIPFILVMQERPMSCLFALPSF